MKKHVGNVRWGIASLLSLFLIAGAILVMGILCFLFLLGRIEQIKMPGEDERATAEESLSGVSKA